MNKFLKNKYYLSLIIKSLIIIIGIIGIVSTVSVGTFMISYNAFLYYTIQSNIVIILISIVFMYLHIMEHKTGRKYIGNNLLLVKFSFTVAITITFLVLFVLLSPTVSLDYLLSFDNFFVHLIVPLLAITDFFMFDYKTDFSNLRYLTGLAMPLYYLFFVFIISFFEVDFMGEPVPYFFMNYSKIGLFFEKGQIGALIWIIILCFVILGISYLISFLCKRIDERSK